MALINISSLDFVDIRQSIKDQIKNNGNFTDYDFEGSTLSYLIDTLAYNSYIAAFNANMVSNEVFIDSATIRENVVALARNIGYIPRPRKSATATISFFIDTTQFPIKPQTITLRKGIVATSSVTFGNQSYAFSIPEDITVPVFNDTASFENIKIYEGTLIEEEFVVDLSNRIQRFTLANAGVDYNTLRVYVKDSLSSTAVLKYERSDALFNIDGSSRVYFIQEVEDERYELIFGDDVFGRKLLNGNQVELSYIINNGSNGNNVSDFAFAGTLFDNENNLIARDISALFTVEPSSGGQSIESIKSIKSYAPRIYASQNRAVTSNDYEAIIKKIYPEAESVTSFGGEELDPPEFGKVYIAIKPTNGLYVSTGIKQNIKRELRNYSVAGILPEIMDVKILYVVYNSRVFYSISESNEPDKLKTKISDVLVKFSKSPEMNRYGSKFRFSKFISLLDNVDRALASNETEISMKRLLQPYLNRIAEYEICYGNRIMVYDKSGFNIKTSGFSVPGIQGTVYFSDSPNADEKTGSLFLFTYTNSTVNIIRNDVGTIDYEKGEILLNAINIVSTSLTQSSVPIISISVRPYSNDVIGLNELFLQIDNSSSTIEMIEESQSQIVAKPQRQFTL
jgi:hypothetical protein